VASFLLTISAERVKRWKALPLDPLFSITC
jgi:hypothetical protein